MIEDRSARTRRFDRAGIVDKPMEPSLTLVGKVGGFGSREEHDSQGKLTGIWIVTFTLLDAKPTQTSLAQPSLPVDVPVRIELSDDPPNFNGDAATASGIYDGQLLQATEVLVPEMGLKLEKSNFRLINIIIFIVLAIILLVALAVTWR
jgi:hypothetical protein